MPEQKKATTAAIHTIPPQPVDNAITFRVPRPNMQVAVLGLVAFITLFQTIQLVRISGSTNTATIKAAPAATNAASQTSTGSGGSGNGAGASTPQSMVGGC